MVGMTPIFGQKLPKKLKRMLSLVITAQEPILRLSVGTESQEPIGILTCSVSSHSVNPRSFRTTELTGKDRTAAIQELHGFLFFPG